MLKKETGQSLVEMAIVTPILIFIFLGIIEVGWGIKNYLSLINATREAARESTRQGSLDFRVDDPGYNSIIDHMLDTIGRSGLSTIPKFSFTQTATVDFYHFYIGTGRPCFTVPCLSSCDNIDQTEINRLDDLILSPNDSGNFHKSYGITRTDTITDFGNMINDLVKENNRIHCEREKRHATNALISDHSLMMVVSQYDHQQLLGFPALSIIDPMLMRTHTVMRSNDTKNQHNACEIAPISIKKLLVTDFPEGSDFRLNYGDFRILRWSDQTDYPNILDTDSLEYFLQSSENHRLNLNEYTNLFDLSDNEFNLGDYVRTADNTANTLFTLSDDEKERVLSNLSGDIKIVFHNVFSGSNIGTSEYALVRIKSMTFVQPIEIRGTILKKGLSCEL